MFSARRSSRASPSSRPRPNCPATIRANRNPPAPRAARAATSGTARSIRSPATPPAASRRLRYRAMSLSVSGSLPRSNVTASPTNPSSLASPRRWKARLRVASSTSATRPSGSTSSVRMSPAWPGTASSRPSSTTTGGLSNSAISATRAEGLEGSASPSRLASSLVALSSVAPRRNTEASTLPSPGSGSSAVSGECASSSARRAGSESVTIRPTTADLPQPAGPVTTRIPGRPARSQATSSLSTRRRPEKNQPSSRYSPP